MQGIIISVAVLTLMVLGLLVNMAIAPRRKLSIEAGLVPQYSTVAGGRLGTLRLKGPFIALRLYDEFIVIGCVRKHILQLESIDRIEVCRWFGMINGGVRFIHNDPEIPWKIEIGVSAPEHVQQIINSIIDQHRSAATFKKKVRVDDMQSIFQSGNAQSSIRKSS